MGYFVQISNDIGTPVFQAAKNYPDVSFASSTLFHALVTASLEHGFVPSVLRAEDATVAIAVHGPPGSRLVIALVTSELAAGQTGDLETRLRWRLSAVYRGALLVAGGDVLRRQPVEALRRLLYQRLAPMVAHVMVEDAAPGMAGRVPRFGLGVCSAAVEWLLHGQATDGAFQQVAVAVARDLGVDLSNLVMAISWQGHAVACTSAWQKLPSVDQALLLSLAEHIGPATFEQPSRTWALEEVEKLWLPSSGVAVVHGAEPGKPSNGLMPLGALPKDGAVAQVQPKRYRMISIRLYPSLGSDAASECSFCEPCQRLGAEATGSGAGDDAEIPRPSWDKTPSPVEACGIREEEFSLVLSLLLEEVDESSIASGKNEAENRSLLQAVAASTAFAAPALDASVNSCGEALLQELWNGLHCGQTDLLPNATAALLLDENTQDAVLLPSPWHYCTASLPWQCRGRHMRCTAARRLMYWIHALPPLGANRPQQYAYCEGYAVGAVRRRDGLHCWAIIDTSRDSIAQSTDGGSDVPTEPAVVEHAASSASDASRVLAVVSDILANAPKPRDLRGTS